MPDARNPRTYEGNFKEEISFSRVVRRSSFAAVHAMLRTFGRNVKACYFGTIGPSAFQVYLVIEPEVLDRARRFGRRSSSNGQGPCFTKESGATRHQATFNRTCLDDRESCRSPCLSP